MKKIILLFFTFSGICCCFSQEPPESSDTVKILQSSVANSLPVKVDSVSARPKPTAGLYPNPAKNKVEIDIRGFDGGFVQVQLLNINGKVVREEKRLLFSGNEIIVFMFSESPGLYYMLVKQGMQMLKKKLVIQ